MEAQHWSQQLGHPVSISVLCVEDDNADVLLIRRMLAGVRNPVITINCVSRLSEALKAVNDVDVVLLDLNLPDSTGLDSLQEVLKARPSVPVVVLTGASESHLPVAALAAGAKYYFVKGRIDRWSLVKAIVRFADLNKPPKAETAAPS